jgi:hypothetical protein
VKGQLGQLGHPQSEGLETGLLQFIGLGPDLEPHVRGIPSGGRALLLTSDGIHSLPAPIFEWVAKNAKALQAATERLVQASEWHGGHDNATAIALGLANGYAEGHSQEFTDFWTPYDRLVIFRPPAAAEPPRAAEPARTSEVPRLPPAHTTRPVVDPPPIQSEPPHPAIAPDEKPAGASKKSRPGRKRSAETGRKRPSSKRQQEREMPRLPIVTIDATPEPASNQNESTRSGPGPSGAEQGESKGKAR